MTMDNIELFFKGCADAEKGEPCDETKGEAYVRVYAYQLEQSKQETKEF